MATPQIAAFNGAKPFRTWIWNDVIACAIYVAPHAGNLNGYVRIPGQSPDRCAATYDGLADIEAHGGLTYGPDDEGWIGFDTIHAWDNWTQEELETQLRESHPEALENLAKTQQILGADSWPPGRISARQNDPYTINWTIEKLEGEVNRLAEQIYARTFDKTKESDSRGA